MVLWNFPAEGTGKTCDVRVQIPVEKKGGVRVVRLNPESAVNNLEQIRNGRGSDLERKPLNLTLRPYEIYWIEITE